VRLAFRLAGEAIAIADLLTDDLALRDGIPVHDANSYERSTEEALDIQMMHLLALGPERLPARDQNVKIRRYK
jgi:hypothetical protein